eukprot:7463132-Lingulodinium_polyedra.AAC.1
MATGEGAPPRGLSTGCSGPCCRTSCQQGCGRSSPGPQRTSIRPMTRRAFTLCAGRPSALN